MLSLLGELRGLAAPASICSIITALLASGIYYELIISKESKMPDTTPLKNSSVPILWVLGGPGSGKGTQCDKIVQKYGFTHISTGDLLRNEVASGSERGKALEAVMKEGQLVSNDVVLELLAEKMLAVLSQSKGFLIDGYPRELDQGRQFEKDIGHCKLVLYFACADQTLVKRLLHRAETSGREDDNEETIKKRLNTFHNHNDPIVKEFETKTKTIDAERDPDAIFNDVVACIDAIFEDLSSDQMFHVASVSDVTGNCRMLQVSKESKPCIKKKE